MVKGSGCGCDGLRTSTQEGFCLGMTVMEVGLAKDFRS